MGWFGSDWPPSASIGDRQALVKARRCGKTRRADSSDPKDVGDLGCDRARLVHVRGRQTDRPDDRMPATAVLRAEGGDVVGAWDGGPRVRADGDLRSALARGHCDA